MDGFAHGSLDVDGLEVVPSLLEHGDEEVEGHHDVSLEFFVVHVSFTDGTSHAGDLSELELNGSSGVVDGGDKGLSLGDDGGEHLDSVKDGSDDNGDSLQTGIGSEEEIELLGPLLDELLVLVELLKLIKGGDIDIELVLLGLFLVLGISDEADLEGGSGDVGKSDGSDESLILLGIVILESNLELNSFSELSGLDGSTEGLDTGEDVSVGKLG